ncbi:class I SAM-dependent methyltransferase [Streptomyces sp. ODS05-4]|uniref:class I SAM-dependent methyltransferase n=1 Tax=Streptomyces sp. ODS05-4 TaxID=2944939 RepID=UPI002108B7A1|nr:class I SAM-dependent methyltransferase [Streptomyces sp. ODS05-4]
MDRHVRTAEDALALLDALYARGGDRRWADGGRWWDGFYAERDRPVPFFADKPDENLVAALDGGLVRPPGRALDLGCGPGRNAVHLARRGFTVDAVDLSAAAVEWAAQRAREAGVDVRFHTGDAFAPAGSGLDGPYDLVHDSGFLHHLPPHRRIGYLALLERVLAPGGVLLLTCFAPGESGASERGDAELYAEGAPPGGLAYTPEALRGIFSGFTELESRPMTEEPPDSPYFGRGFLWTAAFRRED